MKKCMVVLVVAIALCATGSAFGQAQPLIWGEDSAPAVGHTGATLMDGALVQLIVTTITGSGGTPPDPIMQAGTTGANAGETAFTFGQVFAGNGSIAANYPDVATIPGGAATASVIYARVFEQPSSPAATDLLPVPTSDGPSGGTGLWVADMPVVQIVPDLSPNPTIFYNYAFSVDEGDWRFVPVPEPGTFVLAGLGLVALVLKLKTRR